MREILFRAKTKEGKWVEGNLIKRTIRGHVDYQIEVSDFDNFRSYEVIPKTVGQLVRIKKGVKLWEGDKVFSKTKFYSTEFAVVKWLPERCGFYFVADTVGTDIISRNPHKSAFKINSQNVEVIGNIHDEVHEAHAHLLTNPD